MKKVYVIKNIKNCNYYKAEVVPGIKHFVVDVNEAKKYDSKRDCNKAFKEFPKDKFVIESI